MDNVPVYMVINLENSDAESYRQYEKGIFRFIKKKEYRTQLIEQEVAA